MTVLGSLNFKHLQVNMQGPMSIKARINIDMFQRPAWPARDMEQGTKCIHGSEWRCVHFAVENSENYF